MERKQGELIGLQYLRGLAAFAVIVFHFSPRLTEAYDLPEFGFKALTAGVDVFFVISGYIIWHSTQRPGLTPWSWWRSRLIRIVPLYWLMTTVLLICMWWAHHSLPSDDEIVKSFLFFPSTNSRTHEPVPVLIPGWSLNYEFFFYLVMAGLLFLRRSWLRVALIVSVFAGLVSLRHWADPSDAVQFRMTSPLLFEFVAGIGIALLIPRVAQWRYASALGVASIAAAGLFLCLISTRLFPDGPRVIYFGVPAAGLVFGVVCLERALRHRAIKPLKALGDASYSLYLSHTVTILGAAWMMTVAGIHAPVAKFGLSVVLTTLAGLLVYRWVERPLLLWMRTWGTKRLPVPVLAT